jgi:hypothetical protein
VPRSACISGGSPESPEQIIEDLIHGRYLAIQDFVSRANGLQFCKCGIKLSFRDHTVLDDNRADCAELEVKCEHLLGERPHRMDKISDDLAFFSVHDAPSTRFSPWAHSGFPGTDRFDRTLG